MNQFEGSGQVGLPLEFRPAVRNFTDIISRKVSVCPTPVEIVSDTNAGSVAAFELPIAGMLDLTSDIYLQFAAKQTLVFDPPQTDALGVGPPVVPADRFGHLIRSARIFCNNVMVDECMDQGALNSLVEYISTPWQDTISASAAIRGVWPQAYNPLYMSTPIGYRIQTPDDPPADIGPPAVPAVPSMGALPYGYGGPDTPQIFPIYNGMDITQMRNNAWGGWGRWYRIPVSVLGSLLCGRDGIIPLFRLARFRIELTFNAHVLSSEQFPLANTAEGPDLYDIQISAISLGFTLLQSVSLARTYSSDEWVHSFLSWHRGTVRLGAPQTQNNMLSLKTLLPVQTMFKSCRYLIGVLADPEQFPGNLPISSGDAIGGHDFGQSGNGTWHDEPVTNLDGRVDPTRFSYFYGLGGFLGGQATGPWSIEDQLIGDRSFYFGQDASFIPSAINLRHNGEWVYQQDLTTRVDFFREIAKVFPTVKKSAFFSVLNFPGIRTVIVINLGVPEMADGFVSGRRTESRHPVSFLKLDIVPSFGAGSMNPTVVVAHMNLMKNTQLLYWVCHDRQIACDMRNGACVVDY